MWSWLPEMDVISCWVQGYCGADPSQVKWLLEMHVSGLDGCQAPCNFAT